MFNNLINGNLPATNVSENEIAFNIELSVPGFNKEDIKIEQILDNSGSEINLQNIRINIQSLGTSECYWLDSGIFDF